MKHIKNSFDIYRIFLTIMIRLSIINIIAILLLVIGIIKSCEIARDTGLALVTGIIASTIVLSFTEFRDNTVREYRLEVLLYKLVKDGSNRDNISDIKEYIDDKHDIISEICNLIKHHYMILGKASNIEKDIFEYFLALEKQTTLNKCIDEGYIYANSVIEQTLLEDNHFNDINNLIKACISTYNICNRDINIIKKVNKNRNNRIITYTKKIANICKSEAESRNTILDIKQSYYPEKIDNNRLLFEVKKRIREMTTLD